MRQQGHERGCFVFRLFILSAEALEMLLGVESRRRERRSGLGQGSLQRKFVPWTAAVDGMQNAVHAQEVRDLGVVDGRS